MKYISFMGWKNCIELKSGNFKLILTTDIGPRIIGAFLGNSDNLFRVVPETAGKTGGNEWNIYGGHRLWHSPEAKPRSYCADNATVKVKEKGNGISLCSGTEQTTGIHKSITVETLGNKKFRVIHKLRNENLWSIELAAWALTVMAAGGVAVVPQPKGNKKALLPNRYLTIWPYTNMADKRFTWGEEYILMRQNANAKTPCKFGLNCEDGWMAYVNKGVAFVKKFKHLANAKYPDNGCSIESYTCNSMLELETLSPLYILDPGKEITHEETWEAFDTNQTIKTEQDAKKLFD